MVDAVHVNIDIPERKNKNLSLIFHWNVIGKLHMELLQFHAKHNLEINKLTKKTVSIFCCMLEFLSENQALTTI